MFGRPALEENKSQIDRSQFHHQPLHRTFSSPSSSIFSHKNSKQPKAHHSSATFRPTPSHRADCGWSLGENTLVMVGDDIFIHNISISVKGVKYQCQIELLLDFSGCCCSLAVALNCGSPSSDTPNVARWSSSSSSSEKLSHASERSVPVTNQFRCATSRTARRGEARHCTPYHIIRHAAHHRDPTVFGGPPNRQALHPSRSCGNISMPRGSISSPPSAAPGDGVINFNSRSQKRRDPKIIQISQSHRGPSSAREAKRRARSSPVPGGWLTLFRQSGPSQHHRRSIWTTR